MRGSVRCFALLIILLASACSSSVPPAPTQTPGAVALTFWAPDRDRALVEGLVKTWNTSHANHITVTTIPDSDVMTKFRAASASGTAPDLIVVDLTTLPALAAADQMTDITDMAKALPFFDKLSPSHIRLATHDNRLYALPFSAEVSILLYNKGLFKQAGLDPEKAPTNWTEIYNDAKKIVASGDGLYGYYFAGSCAECITVSFLPLIWATGSDILSDDGSKPLLDDPNLKGAMEFYRKLWSQKLVPPDARQDSGTDLPAPFLTGKIGMMSSDMSGVCALLQHPEIDFGVLYLPGLRGGQSSFISGDSIGMPKGAKYSTQAFEFIQWALSDDAQLEQFARAKYIPVRTDLAKNKYFDTDSRLSFTASALKIGRTPYSLHYADLFSGANSPFLLMWRTSIFEGDSANAIKTGKQQFVQIMSGG